ncbi:MAG: hypothetical protein JZU64_09735 [Rhodoferax sp.]|jgi:hypothetical protein|nr:hypothetical protein [Rhodoferax sp.]
MNPPPLPPGIDRDETQHGKLYFTRRQLVEYGQRCFAEGMNCKPASGSQYPRTGPDETVDFLRDIMGMKT